MAIYFRQFRIRIKALAFIGLGLTAYLGPAVIARSQDSAPAASGDAPWPGYNYRPNGQRYSELTEITPKNVQELGEVCRVQIAEPTAFSSGLILVDGVIYASTHRETIAIDAANCRLRWRHTYTPQDAESYPTNRGPAVMDGRVFKGTADGRLLALDAKTGAVLWKALLGDGAAGEFGASAPMAVNGVVYMGVGGGDKGNRGRVVAFDAQTGRELWRFNTIPMGKEIGAETWERPGSAKTGGGGVWGAFSYDVSANELFVPVGNPWPDLYKSSRPGANLFTNSLVVLDASTGALKWWYQATPKDVNDLDLAAAPILYRTSDGRNLAAFAGKDGYVQAVDRETHKLVFRTPITTIENSGKDPTPEGIHICPGLAGGTAWNGPALDPANNVLITGSVDLCFTIKANGTKPIVGDSGMAAILKPDEAATGWIVAVDPETGVVKWRYHADRPVISGITPTAAGVTFAGDMNGNLLALDSKTGALLYKHDTRGAIGGGVITYAIKGKQYVALTSGNVSRNTWRAVGLPAVVIMTRNAVAQAQSGPTLTGPVALGPADPVRGHDIFGRMCSSCHGVKGADVDGHDLRQSRDLAGIVAAIKAPKRPMPKMYPDVLSEQQVADLAAYIHDSLR